jgi:dTDP-glucose 4,6-dehydratase
VRWYVDNKPWWERVMSGAYRQYYDSQYKARLDHAA